MCNTFPFEKVFGIAFVFGFPKLAELELLERCLRTPLRGPLNQESNVSLVEGTAFRKGMSSGPM